MTPTTPNHEPSEFFRSLSRAHPPEEFWAGFWPSVRAGIREAEMRPRPVLTPSGALLLGSSAGIMVAAAMLVVGFLIVPALKTSPFPSGTHAAQLPAERTPVAETAPSSVMPVLENPGPPTARVYTFHVGEKADATDVILIVDESLDI